MQLVAYRRPFYRRSLVVLVAVTLLMAIAVPGGAKAEPSGFKSLIPLYWGGLCEAVIIIPASYLFAAKASVGVGITPPSQHLDPAASHPDISACFTTSLEVLVSVATKTLS